MLCRIFPPKNPVEEPELDGLALLNFAAAYLALAAGLLPARRERRIFAGPLALDTAFLLELGMPNNIYAD